MSSGARDEVLRELAREIASDSEQASPDAHWAWAVQHVNETVLHRNAFSGLDGMSEEHARAGLADYLTDRKTWNVREYEAEVAAGKVRCVAFQGHSTLPDGTLIHRNMEGIVNSWRAAGHVQAEYLPENCPAKNEHRS